MSNRCIVRFGSNRNVAEFTVHDGAGTAEHYLSRRVPISGEIDKASHGPLGPDLSRDLRLVHPVLRREYEAVGG